jgi:replication factor C subunit 3/5
LPPHVSALVARISDGNLRRAILSLEALHTQDPSFSSVRADGNDKDPDVVPRPDWEKYISRTAERILGEQSPERLLEIRGMLYELLVRCIPPSLILSVRGDRSSFTSL